MDQLKCQCINYTLLFAFSLLSLLLYINLMGYFNLYYFANLLLVLIYPIHKIIKLNTTILEREDSFGFTYQNSLIYTMLVMLSIHYIRSYSLPQFISEALVLAKVMIFSFYAFISWEYAIAYLIACIVCWIILSYPKFKGKNNFKKIKSEEQFQELVEKDILPTKTKKVHKKYQQQMKGLNYQNKKMWFIEFYVDWAPTCLHTKQMWAQYSLRYSTDTFKFGSVDLVKIPNLAKRFAINTSGFSRQLPTVIIFQDGEQVKRFPPIDSKTKRIQKVLKFQSKILAKYFDLEQRYLQTKYARSQNNKK